MAIGWVEKDVFCETRGPKTNDDVDDDDEEEEEEEEDEDEDEEDGQRRDSQ